MAISNQVLIWQLQKNKDKIKIETENWVWQIIVWLQRETGKEAGDTLIQNLTIRKQLWVWSLLSG